MKYTSERYNGIKTGFWSPHNKESIVQKLGAIEKEAPALIESICDQCCRSETDTKALPNRNCDGCPVTKLHELIE